MSFTYTGYFIILLSIISFLSSGRRLYSLLLFFIPFTATSVLNIGDINSGSAIQPYMYLTVLLLIRKVLFINKSRYNTIEYIDVILYLFMVSVALSLIMPFIIDGKTEGNITGSLGKTDVIRFSSRNVTQFLYFLLGIIFAILTKKHNTKAKNFHITLKIYGYSLIFVMFWGVIDILCKKLSLPFPEEIFNNSANPSSKGFMQVLEDSTNRISSVSVEPSVLAQSIVIYIPFLLISLKRKYYIFSKIKDIILIGFLIIFTIATTSFSGILSLLFTFWFYFLPSSNRFGNRLVYFIVTFLILISSYYLFIDIFLLISNKVDSYSGIERFETVYSGWENFIEYPYLGIGWGSVTVNDLVVKILANSGIIAIIFFLTLVSFIIKGHKYLLKKNDKNIPVLFYGESCLLSFFVILFNSQLNGFLHYYGMFWFILGLCLIDKRKLIFE